MGFNSAFKGLKINLLVSFPAWTFTASAAPSVSSLVYYSSTSIVCHSFYTGSCKHLCRMWQNFNLFECERASSPLLVLALSAQESEMVRPTLVVS